MSVLESRSVLAVLVSVALASCSSRTSTALDGALDATPAPRAAVATEAAVADASADAPQPPAARSGTPSKPGKYDVSVASAPAELMEFLRTHVPKGGSVTAPASGDPPKVVHTAGASETVASIAALYQPLSELYSRTDLTRSARCRIHRTTTRAGWASRSRVSIRRWWGSATRRR